MTALLGQRLRLTARGLAEHAGISETKARRVLRDLVSRGRARKYKEGRSHWYFATHTGARPDLGLGMHIAIVRPAIDETAVRELARDHQRSSLFGLIGEDEIYDDARLIYRPVYQVVFEEQVKRSMLERLVGPSHDHLMGTTYHHASTLHVLVYTPRRGIEFSDDPGELASRVNDFDGVAAFDDVSPGAIDIDIEAWLARRSIDDVKTGFADKFAARPLEVTPVFVPLWLVTLRQSQRGNYRLVVLDGLVGRPVTWPAGNPSPG